MAKAEAISAQGLRELVQALRRTSVTVDNKSGLRKGTVVSIQAGSPPTCTVTLGGDTAEIPGVGYVQNYRPVVGDTVLMNQQKNDLTIVDKVADSLTPGKIIDGLVQANNAIQVNGTDQSGNSLTVSGGNASLQGGADISGGASVSGGVTADSGTVTNGWTVNGSGTALSVNNGNMYCGGGLTLNGGGTALALNNGGISIAGTLDHNGSNVGFFGTTPAARSTITGWVNGGGATVSGSNYLYQSAGTDTANVVSQLLRALSANGLIVDNVSRIGGVT